MQKKEPSRREREKIRQRQEMLNSAVELFSEKGYHNVSMHEIAAKAEFAIGTLYKFFKNKEDLYKSIIIELGNIFHEVLSKVMKEPVNEFEKLQNYVRAKGILVMNNVPVIRLYHAETRGASFNIKAGLDKELLKDYEINLQQLAQVFKTGMDNKIFQKIAEPYHLAIALDSITNAFLQRWLDSPERHPYPEDSDVILNILFEGLLIKKS